MPPTQSFIRMPDVKRGGVEANISNLCPKLFLIPVLSEGSGISSRSHQELNTTGGVSKTKACLWNTWNTKRNSWTNGIFSGFNLSYNNPIWSNGWTEHAVKRFNNLVHVFLPRFFSLFQYNTIFSPPNREYYKNPTVFIFPLIYNLCKSCLHFLPAVITVAVLSLSRPSWAALARLQLVQNAAAALLNRTACRLCTTTLLPHGSTPATNKVQGWFYDSVNYFEGSRWILTVKKQNNLLLGWPSGNV